MFACNACALAPPFATHHFFPPPDGAGVGTDGVALGPAACNTIQPKNTSLIESQVTGLEKQVGRERHGNLQLRRL